MKRFLIPAALALSLGACSTVPGGVPQIDPVQVNTVIKQVQTTAVAICGFEPTLTTVANILGTLTGVPVGGVTAVASGICNAINSAPRVQGSRRSATRPTYRGVPIYGKRV